jgi:hypothetical protein
MAHIPKGGQLKRRRPHTHAAWRRDAREAAKECPTRKEAPWKPVPLPPLLRLVVALCRRHRRPDNTPDFGAVAAELAASGIPPRCRSWTGGSVAAHWGHAHMLQGWTRPLAPHRPRTEARP